MTPILRAADRFHSTHDGIESWHGFSAGAHYDPGNVSHGALVGCDEHLVAPGAGFDWHAHRGVDIVSWVASGRLQHEDDSGAVRTVDAGQVLVQSCGSGIRHRETNPSTSPLRLVQMTVLGSGPETSVRTGDAPLDVTAGRIDVWRDSASATAERWHVFVVDGLWHLDESALQQGDSARGAGRLTLVGAGAALVWLLSES